MKDILLMLYEFLTVMVPVGIVLVVFHRNKGKYGGIQIILTIVFAIYMLVVLHLTGAGTLYDIFRYGLEINGNQINVIPFSDFMNNRNVYMSQALLNILLFVPFGLLIPLIWQEYRKVWTILLLGFLLSFVIECSQLVNHRSFDIDDLIYNTCGTLLGGVVFKFFFHPERWKYLKSRDGKMEVIIIIITAFLLRFLLFDEMGAAKLLYGF